ncbi:MAG: rare lipoprotein A [Saprospiraceae bacterium]|jgi:rare lipoprotein A
MHYKYRIMVSALFVLLLSGCSSNSTQPSGVSQSAVVAAAKAKTESRYAIKQDLGPKQHKDMSNAPDAVPKVEPHSRGGNKSRYEVWGKSYSVMASSIGFKQRGLASWYGQKFHGHLTSNGETYDMYAMTAAHKSLPLPTYARITNLANNRTVIVRVNDRGPFHGDRVIDLSYAAASKLDYRKTGVAEVLVEAIDARQWSPALEQSIRKQRKTSRFKSPANTIATKSDSNSVTSKIVSSSVKAVTQSKAPMKVPLENEIRQQHKRVAGYYVQVAAMSKIGGALVLRNTLVQEFRRSNIFVEQASDRADLFRVLVGPITDVKSVRVLMQELASSGHGQGLMIKP